MKTKRLWKPVLLMLAFGAATFLSLPKGVAAQGGPSGILNEILAAIPRSGIVRRTIISWPTCVTVAGPIDPGRQRALTITIETTNIDATAIVRIDNSLSSILGYIVDTSAGHPETFVESVTNPEVLRVCNLTEGSAMHMSAIWTESTE